MTETDEGNVKINSSGRGGGVRQKIRAFSRKISTMERKDINGDIIKKMATFFVAVLFVLFFVFPCSDFGVKSLAIFGITVSIFCSSDSNVSISWICLLLSSELL